MIFDRLFGKSSPDKKEGEEENVGAFERLRRGLGKTRDALTSLFGVGRKLDDDLLEEVETLLIESDFGPGLAMDLCDQLRDAYKDRDFDAEEIVPFLKSKLREKLSDGSSIGWAENKTTVIVVAGVNGVGKTTSIAKLAHQWRSEGRSIVLAAGDTFRAAAADQLGIWSDRLGVDMVRGAEGADPASVVFDAVKTAEEKGADILMIDTAGRLHTEKPLMDQLGKIGRVISRNMPDAPHEVLQVLDATTGQNAIQQTRAFNEVMPVTGLVLTKLDGTARGGVIFPILEELSLPVKYIGVGEGVEDLQTFDPDQFIDALFD
ncbi:MAG: signal recognition particle-docking protein FtsY [Planctomycetia bacterium TMED53]|nr:MAG: signal recognition particle-docking protein FtsY [Planctomycetia bacterium TMED53]